MSYRKQVERRSAWVRPLTNLDPGNVFPAPFGKARPLKHYRRGHMPVVPTSEEGQSEDPQITYNLDRNVRSSRGGAYAVLDTQDRPGGVMPASLQPTECSVSVTTQVFHDACCQARHGIQRTYPANTNLPKTYASSNGQYLQQRCRTFAQKSVHFAPEVAPHTYRADCWQDESCSTTVYKPNNPSFAVQGGVDASLYTLQRNVRTLTRPGAL